jgi:hypothetical protein
MVFAMPEVVFQVVSVVFKHIVVLILYFPAGAGAFYEQSDILFCDGFVGNPTVL